MKTTFLFSWCPLTCTLGNVSTFMQRPIKRRINCTIISTAQWTRSCEGRTGCCGSLGVNSSPVRRQAKPLNVHCAPGHSRYLGRLMWVVGRPLLFCLGSSGCRSCPGSPPGDPWDPCFELQLRNENPQVGSIPKLQCTTSHFKPSGREGSRSEVFLLVVRRSRLLMVRNRVFVFSMETSRSRSASLSSLSTWRCLV